MMIIQQCGSKCFNELFELKFLKYCSIFVRYVIILNSRGLNEKNEKFFTFSRMAINNQLC